jgi:zinc-binding alcohol dehydrogenase/oxidoreductase
VRAAYFKEKNQPLVILPQDKPVPVKDQVLVRLKSAALNHRDLWIWSEQKTPVERGIILGSDGSGVIEAIGEEIEEDIIGQEVIINPALEWGKNPNVQGDSFRILGFPDHGTFADYLLIQRKYVFEKPEHLSFDEAAAIPLSALTAYRALFSKARIRPDEKVLITGIGGGAALWAMLMAKAFRARVFVTSGSDEKIKTAIKLGASRGFNYNEAGWDDRALKESGGYDVIIDSAAGSQFHALLNLALPGARIVMFGRTAGNIPDLSPQIIFRKQLQLMGTTMGTRDEFLSMLDFVHKFSLRPVIDSVHPLEQVNEAMKKMERGSQFGKVVLKISE